MLNVLSEIFVFPFITIIPNIISLLTEIMAFNGKLHHQLFPKSLWGNLHFDVAILNLSPWPPRGSMEGLGGGGSMNPCN